MVDEITEQSPAEVFLPSPRQVAAIRGYFDLTLAEAAERFGISKQTLGWLERGQRKPQNPTLMMIGLAVKQMGVKIEGDTLVLPP